MRTVTNRGDGEAQPSRPTCRALCTFIPKPSPTTDALSRMFVALWLSFA